ncbi:AMP-binding protein [Streptomyces sp. NPDC059517]|uniref:AMP-binding protein n=1 Tax=Streptomyces sp. NPDC059517 TaxID=3346855 RepID=UPI0036798852
MSMATVRERFTEEQIQSYYADGSWCDYNFFDALERQVRERPDKVFVTDSTTSYTFRELRDAALRLAVGLVRRGVAPGDRVTVQVPNWTEFVVISLAVSRVGALIVPIMPIYRRDEVGHIVGSAGPKVAFTTGRYRGFDHDAMFLDMAGDSPTLDTVIVVRGERTTEGSLRYEDVLAEVTPEEAGAELPAAPGPDEPWVIVFSSGTTSRPKGCAHTFNTMATGARLLGRGWHYTEEDVQFGPSPITHTTGLVTSVILPLIHGASSHIMEKWEPREGLARIAKFRCTAAVTATTFLQMLLNAYDPDVHDAGSMRFWTCAGAPIPGTFVQRAVATLPDMRVLSLYGRTENITTTMCTLDDDPARSVTSDGKALPFQEVRIVDGQGEEVPRGTEGDIAYRGAMNALGYINQPEETASMFTADGFSRSGDLGVMDDDGYVRVTGRLKDIVIRGGLNISVRQVEDLLSAHPAVGEVAVVGMPDEKMGEKVCCYLVPAAGAEPLTLEEIRDYLLGEGLAIQKVPERLEIIAALPSTATGKIQKHVLRSDIADKLKAGR